MSGASIGGSSGERAPALAKGLSAFVATAADTPALLDAIASHVGGSLAATIDVAALRAGPPLDVRRLIRSDPGSAPSRLVDGLLLAQPPLVAELEAGRPQLVTLPERESSPYARPVALWPLLCASRFVGLIAALRPEGAPKLTENELQMGRPWADCAALALGHAVALTEASEHLRERQRLSELLRVLEGTPQASSRARLSHELRTPLNVIIGFSSLLHSGKAGPLGEAQREYLGDILSSAKRLLGSVNEVLEAARGEAPSRVDAEEEPHG